MKNNKFIKYSIICLALSLFPSVSARAENLCREIANNPKIEEYFATHRTKILDLPKTKDAPARRFEVTSGTGGGTCHMDEVKFSENGKDNGTYLLECDYNGCGLGAAFSIAQWENKIYFLAEGYNADEFEHLNGWKDLSKTERAKIKFRNLTYELYLVTDDGKAGSVCESNHIYNKQYVEKSISSAKICTSLSSEKTKSVFPEVSKHRDYSEALKIESNPFDIQHGTYSFPRQMILLDLDGDGIKEKIVPAEGSATAGCGCDVSSFILLDDKNQPIVAKNDFEKKIMEILQNVKCGEKLDLIESNSKYYIEKKTRVGTREILPLSGDDAFKPICAYVNDAPLAWH